MYTMYLLMWLQGRSQDFSKGGSQRLLTRCSPSCISGLSRIIAAWRSILTKDKSRWWKHFTKNLILKKWAFQQWLLRPRYCHGVFATWILQVVCSKEGLPRGGHGHPRTPPSYAPGLKKLWRGIKRMKYLCMALYSEMGWLCSCL